MEINMKIILGIIGAIFLLGIAAPVYAGLDNIDDSTITTDNCPGSTVIFTLNTNSATAAMDTTITVNEVTKVIHIPQEHGTMTVKFLAEDVLTSMSAGTYNVDVDVDGQSATVPIVVTECGLTCNVATDVLDDLDYDDEVAPEDTLNVDVNLDNQEDQKFYDVKLKAWIEDENGDRLGERVETDEFDLSIDEEDDKILKIEVPEDADEGDYTLYVRAESDQGCLFEETRDVEITRNEDSLKLEKVGFDSETNAGKDFNVAVTVLNNGQNDEKDVRVTVELEGLDLSQKSQYFDIENDEKITQYFTLTIPENVKEGEYTLSITAKNDDVKTTKDYTIKISGEKVVTTPEVSASLSVLQATKNLVKETGDIFRVTVTNTGDNVETFTFKAAGTTGWSTYSIEPGIATIAPGESEDVYLYVSPKATAEEKEYPITFYVNKDSEIVNSVSLTGIVEGKQSGIPELTSEQIGMWIFIIIIVVIAVLFGVWTYTSTTAKKGKGKEKYY